MGRPPNPIDPTASLTALYGWKIRTLREEKGWTQSDLGRKIAMSCDAVSKLELGKSAPDDRTGELLDQTFNTGGYFHEHAPLVRKERIPTAARSLAENESAAQIIQVYEPCLITGLLQTEDYIRARADTEPHLDDVEGIVAQRLSRQRVLTRAKPPRLLVVTDEAALRRPIGGPVVFKAQLEHLEQMLRHRHISVHAVPETRASYAGLTAGFTIISFTEGPDVAFVDGPCNTGQFFDDSDTVTALSETYDLIRSAALSDMQTADLIRQIREAL